MHQPSKNKGKASLFDMLSGTKSKIQDSGSQAFTETQTTDIITGSESQFQEARNNNLASHFNKVMSQKSKEAQEAEKIAEEERIRLEGLSTPVDRVEEIIKEDKGEDKLIEFKKNKNKIEELLKENTARQANLNSSLVDDNGINLFSPLYYLWDTFSPDTSGMSDNQAVEYTQLVKKQKLDLDIALPKVKKEIQDSYNAKAKLIEEKQKEIFAKNKELKDKNLGFVDFFSEMFSKDSFKTSLNNYENSDEISTLLAAQRFDKNNLENINAYLSGKSGAWEGLKSQKKDLVSLGLANMVDELGVAYVASKDPEDWNENEKELMKSFALKQEIDNQDIHKNKFWYKAGQGTGQSLTFMEGMLVSGGATSGIKGTVQGGVRQSTKSIIKKGLEEGGKTSLKRKLGLLFLRKGGDRAIGSGVQIATQGLLMPSTYTNAASNYTGQTEIQRDEEGNITGVLVRDSLYNKYKKEYETYKYELESEYNSLKEQEELSEADQERLGAIQQNLIALDEEMEMLKPASVLKSGAYGYTESLKEIVAERYVGERVAPALINNKVTRYLSQKLTGTKAGKLFKSGKEIVDKGINTFNNTAFGKISSKAMYHTNGYNLIDSIPGEVFEEMVVQATPTVGQDYAEQLQELVNPSFYADVLAQTVLMQGGTTPIGIASQLANYKKAKAFYDKRKSIRNAYRQIDKAITDEDLAETIVMNTGGTGFSILDYNHKIAKLRSEGKLQEAKKLEEKKFFNLAVTAMQTNTLDEFEKVLDSTSTRNSFSPETIVNIELAKSKLQEVKKVYEKYKDKPNAYRIVSLAAQKVTNKQSLSELEKEMLVQKDLAREEIDAFLKREKIDIEYSMDTLVDRTFEDETENTKYLSFLDKLSKEGLTAVETYLDLQFAKENLEYAHLETMKQFNEQVSPKYQENLKKEKQVRTDISKYIQAIQNGDLESNNAVFNYNNELQLNADLVEEIFDAVDKRGLSTEKVKELKKQYMKAFEAKSEKDVLQEVNDILSKYESNKKEAVTTGQEELDTPETFTEEYDEDAPDTDTSESLDEPGQAIYGTMSDEQDTDDPDTQYERENPTDDFNPDDNREGVATDASVAINNVMTTPDAGDYNRAESSDLFPTGDSEYTLEPMSTEDFSDDKKEIVRRAIKDVFTGIEKATGNKPTFEELVLNMIKYVGKEVAESQFDAYALGWKQNNYTETDFNEVYNNIFDPLKNLTTNAVNTIQSLFEDEKIKEPTVEELTVNTVSQQEEIESKQAEAVSFTEENIPVVVKGAGRINHPKLSLAFNAIRYEEITDEEGNVRRQSILTNALNLDENSIVDFRSLLHPDKALPGDNFDVGVAPENTWDNITISIGRDANGKPILKTFSAWLQEKEAENPNFRETKEFSDIVPILVFDKAGTPVSYIHDTNWFNSYNVADPEKDGVVNPNSPSGSQRQLIEEGRKNTSDLRTQIVNNNISSIKIESKKEGPFYSIANRKDADGNTVPLYTVNEANPQAEIAVQVNQGVLEVGRKNPFENKNRKIINKAQILSDGGAGHTWQLRRVGRDLEDGKETWRAFKVVRYVTPEQLETVRWAWAAYAKFDLKVTKIEGVERQVIQEVYKENVPNTPYDISQEQAKKIIEDIKKETGYNLLKYQHAQDFFKQYLQPRTGDSLAEFGRKLYKEGNIQALFSQHTLNSALGTNPKMVSIEKGNVRPTGKTYTEYLKDTLQTDVKSFNIGTEENPMYVTSIQPTITFSYENVEVKEDTPQESVEVREKEILMDNIEKTGEINVDKLVEEFESLKETLGFDFDEFSAMPVTMQGTESLEGIFNTTPGLTIAQEKHLVNFIYTYISSAIDVKYKAKVTKAQVLKELEESYDDIVGSVPGKLQAFLFNVGPNPTDPKLLKIKEEAEQMLEILDNIKNHWSASSLQKFYEKNGYIYKNQEGLVEKALLEINKTSDIKEQQDTEDEIELEEDLSQREKSYEDNASLVDNGKQKTTYRLRRFMAGVKRRDANGNIVKGFLGLPEYVGFNEVYDTIYQLLGTGTYIPSDYNIMKAKILEMKEAQPWVTELMEKFDNADEQLRKEFAYNYRKHAISMKFAMYSLDSDGAVLKVYDTNANEITRVILDGWSNNLLLSPAFKKNESGVYLSKEKAQELINIHNEFLENTGKVSTEDLAKWLENFGIDLSEGYYKELREFGFKNKTESIDYEVMFRGSNTFIGQLRLYLDRVIKEEGNLYFNNKEDKNHPFKDMSGVLKALSKGETRYTAKMLSKSFRDAGKNISGLTNPTYITNRIDDIKRGANPNASTEDKALLENLKKVSLSKGSLIIKLLEEDPEFHSKFEINYLGLTAIKELGKKATGFASITDLNRLDHETTKLTFFQDTRQERLEAEVKGFSMRVARMFLPTMSDKTQMMTVATGVFNFMQESNIAFTRDENGDLKFSEDLRELLYEQLALPELERILNFHNKVKTTDVKNYDLGAQIFHMIPALNNIKDSDGSRMIKEMALVPNITLGKVEEKYKDAIKDALEEIVHSMAAKKKDLYSSAVEVDKTGEISKIKIFDTEYLNKGQGTLAEKFEVGIYDFLLNSVITNANMFTLLAGDPAFYSQDKNFKKKLPYELNDTEYISLAKATGVNIGKRLALLIAPGQTLADSHNQQYKQVFLEDAEDIAENSEYLISLFYGAGALNETINEEGQLTVKEGLDIIRDKEAKNYNKKAIKNSIMDKFPKIAEYFDIESTDAQEYTTLKEHIYVMRNQGRMSEELYTQVKSKIEKGEHLTKEELGIVMQPIKPVATGQVFDEKQDMMRVIYIKSSSFPLIPQLTAGLELDKLRVKLEELEEKHGMPVRASYQTANKVGAMVNATNPLSDTSLQSIENSMLTLNRNDFRIQQDVPFKSDMKKEDKVSMGTQIFKLLLGNGMLNEEGFMIDGKQMNGKELQQYYSDAFSNLARIKREKLFKSLGLDNQGRIVNKEENIKRLQEVLKSEAESRGYPIQDIKSLELSPIYNKEGEIESYEFKMPLWLAVNSNRFESLLNSVVSNKLMKYKIPGNSFVAGSENGFSFKDNLEGIDKSRVIFLDTFNGKELQATRTEKNEDGSSKLIKAQVFVPSKFKTPDGKLLDLFKRDDNGFYIYLDETDKGLKLKPGMIAPELLNMFSFRTPTSSHVSGSSIEIAGILPPEVGDLMIVPKNLTKQKGLDFDIDKETVYQLNHIVNPLNGKVEVLTEKHKENALKGLRKLLQQEQDLFKSDFGHPAMEDFYTLIGSQLDESEIKELQNEGANIEKQIEIISNRFDEKIYENQFVKTHLAVFNNPNANVQKKINKVLSMDFARVQADRIENLIEEAKQYSAKQDLINEEEISEKEASSLSKNIGQDFTILSDEYQKDKMGLGAAGKVAIGIYSNYVTFHGLLQQTPVPCKLQKTEANDKGKMVKKDFRVSIGKLESDGVLGKETTLDGERSIAEAFAEKQNTATDNEKEQILGRVNVNSLTIGVDSLLTLLGFDKDEQGNSIPYQLLSQPIIREYVENINSAKGITSTYIPDLEMQVAQSLLEKYSGGTNYQVNDDGEILDVSKGEVLNNSSILTGEALTNGIKYPNQNAEVQLETLALFLKLDKYAKNIAKTQSVVNTNNLGKSIIESSVAYKALEEFPNNSMISNVGSLLGEFIDFESVGRNASSYFEKGYYPIGEYLVKPTTPQGQIVIHGLQAGKRLWGDYFPYTYGMVEHVISNTLSNSNLDSSTAYKEIENKQHILSEMKKYIYSSNSLGIFEGTARENRQRLFYDTPTNTSLSSYLSKNKNIPYLLKNRLISKFTFEAGVEGRPSLIKFNNTISDNFDQEYLYSALAEMIIMNKPLPEFNGDKDFTTRKLAQELITYAYIEGGVQEATQFIKYIPLEYLEEVGIEVNGEFKSALSQFQKMSSASNAEFFKNLLGEGKDKFVKQYFQHNPDKAVIIKDAKSYDYNKESGQLIINSGDEISQGFVAIRNSTKSKLKQDKFTLFEQTSPGVFKRIDVLGATGMNEYDSSTTDAKTIVGSAPKVTSTQVTPVNNISNRSETKIKNFLELGNNKVLDVLDNIANDDSITFARYAEVARLLKPFADEITTVEVLDNDNMPLKGVRGAYGSASNRIVINSERLFQRDKGVGTFIHEFIHSITKRELEQYYDSTGTKISANAPAHVVQLHMIWQEARKQLAGEALSMADSKARALKANQGGIAFTQDEMSHYPLTDIFEFIVGVMENRKFQEMLASKPYMQTGKTFLDKFKEAVAKLVAFITPNTESKSLLEDSIIASLNFLEEEKGPKKPQQIFTSAQESTLFEDEEFDSPDNDDLDDPDSATVSGPTINMQPMTLTEYQKKSSENSFVDEETLNLQEDKQDDLDCPIPF